MSQAGASINGRASQAHGMGESPAAADVPRTDAGSLVEEGRRLMEEKRLGDAIGRLLEAVDADPRRTESYLVLARALIAAEWYDQADLAIRKAAELSPEDAGVFRLCGESARQQGKFREAAVAFERAADILEQADERRREKSGSGETEEVSFPLVLGEERIHFLHLETEGDLDSMKVVGLSTDGRWRVTVPLWGPGVGGASASGVIARDPFLRCLTIPVRSRVELVSYKEFHYELRAVREPDEE